MSTKARERARELRRAREEEERQRLKRRRLLTGGGVIIVGLLVAIVVTLVNAAGGTGGPAAQAGANSPRATVTPAGATASGALVIGEPAAPVRLEIFADYMCPYCGRFERANGGELERLVADGTVRLELHPLSFLDRMSNGSKYSTRTANAVATVADRAPQKLLAFNAGLYASQPAEGSEGLTNEEIAALATRAGVPPDVVRSFGENTFEPWVTASTATAFAGGITGTPTVRIDGTVFKGNLYTVGPLTAAIMSAKAG